MFFSLLRLCSLCCQEYGSILLEMHFHYLLILLLYADLQQALYDWLIDSFIRPTVNRSRWTPLSIESPFLFENLWCWRVYFHATFSAQQFCLECPRLRRCSLEELWCVRWISCQVNPIACVGLLLSCVFPLSQCLSTWVHSAPSLDLVEHSVVM